MRAKLIVIQSDLDSLNTLIKKSPERAIRYARELLDRIVPGEDFKNEYKINNTLGEIFFGFTNVRTSNVTFYRIQINKEKVG